MLCVDCNGGLCVRLTVYTDYALRLLMYLAVKDDGLATIEEVASSYCISKNHHPDEGI